MFWLIGISLTVVYYIVLIKIDRKKQAAFQIEQRAIPKIKIDASFQSLQQASLSPTETTSKSISKIEQQATTPIESNTEKEIEKKILVKIGTESKTEAIESIPPKEKAKEKIEKMESNKSKIDETISEKIEATTIEVTATKEEEPDETTIESNNYLANELLEYQANLTRQQIVDRIEPYKNQVTLTELDIKNIVTAVPLSEEE